MKTYIVLYRPDYLMPTEAPFGFRCQADDADHAEEQCANAYPDCDIVWVWEGDSMQDALDDYWDVPEELK
jgi:hypothetical protein